jgi:hypothetical protein
MKIQDAVTAVVSTRRRSPDEARLGKAPEPPITLGVAEALAAVRCLQWSTAESVLWMIPTPAPDIDGPPLPLRVAR